jgi:hypothetical protein
MRAQGAAPAIVITEKPMTHEERRTLEACREVCVRLTIEALERIENNKNSHDPVWLDEQENACRRLLVELSR